jgi:hypothetical protein
MAVATLNRRGADTGSLIVERNNSLHVAAIQAVGRSEFILLSNNGLYAKLEKVLSDCLCGVVSVGVGRDNIDPRGVPCVDVEAV